MTPWTRLAAILLLCAATPAAAQQAVRGPDAPTTTSSEEQQRALTLALDRGRALYLHDQAAWHTTDALLEDIADPAALGIGGWVVTNAEDGLLVTFWAPESDGFAGVYSARYASGQVLDRRLLEGGARTLGEEQIALIAATQAIDPSGLERCSGSPFNTVALPPQAAGEPILVYYLTPRTTNDTIPLGGHYRFEVRGGLVAAERGFTTSCFDMPLPQGENRLEALVATHLLDPVPTEIHVFSMLALGLPLMVVTAANELIWAIEIVGNRPRVELVGRVEDQQ